MVTSPGKDSGIGYWVVEGERGLGSKGSEIAGRGMTELKQAWVRRERLARWA